MAMLNRISVLVYAWVTVSGVLASGRNAIQQENAGVDVKRRQAACPEYQDYAVFPQ